MYLDGMRKDIIAWVQQGLNDREIADRCRVSRSGVRYWRERNGVERPAKNEASESPQKGTVKDKATSRDPQTPTA
jgi:transposase